MEEIKPRYFVNADGYTRLSDYTGLTKVDVDSILDLLEIALDDAAAEMRNMVLGIVHGGTLPERYYIYKEAHDALEQTWHSLDDSDTDTYYVSTSWWNKLRATQSLLPMEVQDFCKQLYVLGTVVVAHREVQFTVEQGAILATVVDEEAAPAYCNILCKEARPYVVDAMNYTQHKNTVRYILMLNATCRFFKCKDCGKVVYVSKEKDEEMQRKGLSPTQRCYECYVKRKQERKARQENAALSDARAAASVKALSEKLATKA